MQNDSGFLRGKINDEATAIANAMLTGLDSWEAYQRLLGRSQQLAMLGELLVDQERRALSGDDWPGETGNR